MSLLGGYREGRQLMPTGTGKPPISVVVSTAGGGFTSRWISPAKALIQENTHRRGIATLHELAGEGN
jgi:hypothetical protein